MDTSKVTAVEVDDHIRLRPFVAADAPAVFDLVARNYNHLRTFMEWAKPDYSISDAEEFVSGSIREHEGNASLNFGIYLCDKLVGVIGFASIDHNSQVAELGYWIDQNEEGRGIVSKSCAHLLDTAFNKYGLNRVQIRCASGNVRSSAIPERFGFKKEGVQRQHIMRDGIIYDFVIYGLLASEWNKLD
jgi:ribosomal-protein-serine acetyltransferase